HAELPPDVAVADDSESLAADLVAARGHLSPATLVDLARAVAELPGQRDDLGEDELGDAAGVREGRVEDRDAAPVGGLELDLVRADAEAADGEQAPRAGQRRAREAGLRADAEDVHVGETRGQLVGRERPLQRLHLEALGPEDLERR